MADQSKMEGATEMAAAVSHDGKENGCQDFPEQDFLEKRPVDDTAQPRPDGLLPIPDTFVAHLSQNKRVTPQDHWQDVRHLNLDIHRNGKQERMEYLPGTTLVIYPKNIPQDVQMLIDRMSWQEVADKPVKFVETETKTCDLVQGIAPWPDNQPARVPEGLYMLPNATLRDLLLHNFDITAIPKRRFLHQMQYFTADSREKERLRQLTGGQDFFDYAARPRRTILEVLRDFPGVSLPFHRVLDTFPLIRGREFSICNGGANLESGIDDQTSIQLLVALVEYKTIIRKPREGLCSRYLKHLPVGIKLIVKLRECKKGPNSIARPVIAVATGTGVAPIRALTQLRLPHEHRGPVLLFFGCRNEKADFYFREEWSRLGNFVRVIPAFSRDPVQPEDEVWIDPYSGCIEGLPSLTVGFQNTATSAYDRGRNYVQHMIRKHSQDVVDLLLKDTKPLICICGNAGRMPLSVQQALRDALILRRVCENQTEATKWLADPQNVTIWQETW